MNEKQIKYLERVVDDTIKNTHMSISLDRGGGPALFSIRLRFYTDSGHSTPTIKFRWGNYRGEVVSDQYTLLPNDKDLYRKISIHSSDILGVKYNEEPYVWDMYSESMNIIVTQKVLMVIEGLCESNRKLINSTETGFNLKSLRRAILDNQYIMPILPSHSEIESKMGYGVGEVAVLSGKTNSRWTDSLVKYCDYIKEKTNNKGFYYTKEF